MLSCTCAAMPSASEIDHLIAGLPSWYPAGQASHTEWQIPIIPAPSIEPLPKMSRGYDKRSNSPCLRETVLHGYLSDRKLRTHLRAPGRWVTRFNGSWGIVAPDFSIWLGSPPDRKIFAVRMSRAVGLFHALRGIRVIPNLRWGDSRDYDFCFLGVEQGSAVAVSNHGLWNDQLLRHNFLSGLPVMAERIQPKVVFVHGTTDNPAIRRLERTVPVERLEPDWTRFRRTRANGRS